jgi:hypothetical protein
MTDAKAIARGLTKAQAWALAEIIRKPGIPPSMLGQHMLERPGARLSKPALYHRSQGNGRLGGAMAARLAKIGLVRTMDDEGWPHITALSFGRAVAAALREPEA